MHTRNDLKICMKINKIILLSLATIFVCSCNRLNNTDLATVETLEPTSISGTSATVGGNISSSGGSIILRKGVCWNNVGNEQPAIETDYSSFDGNGTGEYAATMSSLSPNTCYQYRAYATNVYGTAYGEMKSFTTLNEVTIGNKDSYTNGQSIPFNAYYYNSYTQQIVPSSLLGGSGKITSMIVYNTASNSPYTRSIKIYMKNVSVSHFETNSSWISLSNSDLVYSGNITFGNGDEPIVFDTPFYHNGQNLLICFVDSSSEYVSGKSFYTFMPSNDNRSLYNYSDNTNYSIATPPASGTLMPYINHMTFIISYN